LGKAGCTLRRNDGHDLLHPRLSAWTSARLVCHVPRRTVAETFQSRASALSDSGLFHLGRGLRRWSPRRSDRHRHARRSVEYRNAFRICIGLARSGNPALSRPESAPRIPCSWRRALPRAKRDLLRAAHGGTAHSDLAPLLRLADNWPGSLLLLQSPA